ncbi:MAG TPA: MFS transporter [Flavobacteriales bacterium]|nr:MFS transporter [Flavobacteriales bacterium]
MEKALNAETTKPGFTKYQKLVILIISLIQFTVVLDFMIMNPISDMLMKDLSISAAKLGIVVSAYAFSAAISGIAASGFADRYDRKRMLVFFYSGFCLGTLVCAFAPTFEILLTGRIVAGIFGGVLSSISMAIISDLFPIHMRGRVMGFTQMAFAVSQVLGIPLSLFFANKFGWYFPFILIAIFIALTWLFIAVSMKPIREHLALQKGHNAFKHMTNTIANRQYRVAFIASCLMPIGGYMLMPFGNPFLINNLEVSPHDIPLLFLVTGICSMFIMPMVGKISDSLGKFKTMVAGSILASFMVIIYANMLPVPLWVIIMINALMFAGIMSRIVPAQALITAVPDMADRGAFMSMNASLTSLAGGIAALAGGLIVYSKDIALQTGIGRVVQLVKSGSAYYTDAAHFDKLVTSKTGIPDDAFVFWKERLIIPIHNYDVLSYVVVAVMALCVVMVFRVNKIVIAKHQAGNKPI